MAVSLPPSIGEALEFSEPVTIDSPVSITAQGQLTLLPGASLTWNGNFDLTIFPGGILWAQGTREIPVPFYGVNGGANIYNRSAISAQYMYAEYVRFRNSGSVGQNLPLEYHFHFEDCHWWGGGFTLAKRSDSKNYFARCIGSNPFEVKQYYTMHGGGLNGSIFEDNVFHGGTWTTGQLVGKWRRNVFVSLYTPEGNINDHTHEHTHQMGDYLELEENIFVGQSYAAMMTNNNNIGIGVLARNNTVDPVDGTIDLMTFHTVDDDNHPSPGPTLRNNLLLRGRYLVNHDKGAGTGAPHPVEYTDYNACIDIADFAGRYFNVAIQNGNGANDLNLSDPTAHLVNPGYGANFAYDRNVLASFGISAAEVLDQYRAAYTPLTGSPLLGGGDPQDGAPNIGAVGGSAGGPAPSDITYVLDINSDGSQRTDHPAGDYTPTARLPPVEELWVDGLTETTAHIAFEYPDSEDPPGVEHDTTHIGCQIWYQGSSSTWRSFPPSQDNVSINGERIFDLGIDTRLGTSIGIRLYPFSTDADERGENSTELWFTMPSSSTE